MPSSGGVVFDRRVSLSMLCYPQLSLPEFLDEAAAREVVTVGLVAQRTMQVPVAEVRQRLGDNGLSVSALVGGVAINLNDPASWPATRDELNGVVDTAAAVGAPSLYVLTGARPRASWDDPIPVFAEAIGPSLEHARSAGVRIAVEPANWLYADLTFVHNLTDAIEVAEAVGTAICVDLFHLWTELHFAEVIARAVPHIAHVQLGDFVAGDRFLPSRAVPGDGVIPLDRLIDQVRAAGYPGAFDLEVNGPRIDEEGHSAAAARALTWLAHALD
jgi:sugar phosphate isomerase/epimerase